MKNKYKWLLDKTQDLIQLIFVIDYIQKTRKCDDYFGTHDEFCNLLFSMLWVAMGNNVPNDLYRVNDFSVLYGVIDESEEIEIED